MNAQDPTSFVHKTAKLGTGRTYHFVDQLPAGYDRRRTLTLLCVHGFPGLWYDWRFQIGPWVTMGYRVVVPDMLGYGGSDKPFDASEYSTKKLSADLAALLDHLEIKKAVLVGHDWGAYTGGRFALWHPNRLLALVILSVPFTPPTPEYVSIEQVAKRAPNLAYQVFFNDPRSTAVLEEDLPSFFNSVFLGKDADPYGPLRILKPFSVPDAPEILNEAEMKYYLDQYQKSGLNGPLNYYRTAKFRHDEELAAGLPSTSNLRPDLHVLFLWGTKDPTCTVPLIAKAHKFIPRLQDIALDGKGHWLTVEAKDEVTDMIGNWLSNLSFVSARM